jgi:hypothetical protein
MGARLRGCSDLTTCWGAGVLDRVPDPGDQVRGALPPLAIERNRRAVFRSIAWAIAAALLLGCATKAKLGDAQARPNRLGDVAVKTIEAPPSESYKPEHGVAYDYPEALPSNPLPNYPGNLLGQDIQPVHVRVRVIVDERGRVTDALPIEGAIDGDPRFFPAVAAAVRSWRFRPLVKMERGPGTTQIVSGDTTVPYEGRATALPFHLDYEFAFSQRDGKGVVTTVAEPRQ